MNAHLNLSCSCGGRPLVDDNLALSDAVTIRTWTTLHSQPGHTVTATIVASYEDGPARVSHLHALSRNLQRTVSWLLRY